MSARNHRLEGRWLKILRTMPVLPEIPGIADWLKAQNLQITADQNPTYAGEIFDPERFPVVSRLVFKYFETPSAFELFCIKPVQSTYTTHVWFALCHVFIYRPCTAILVMHTRQEVRKKKKDTYAPIIAAIPDLAGSERLDGTETTAEEFRFSRSTLYVGGGQSASVLTSTAANIVILDECGEHKTGAKRPPSPWPADGSPPGTSAPCQRHVPYQPGVSTPGHVHRSKRSAKSASHTKRSPVNPIRRLRRN